jgi:hypothetical protein
MPNWCYNSVTLHHDNKEVIDGFEQELLKEDAQPFNHLRPRPASEEENWYDWNINNWGCKWDVSMMDWEREDDNTIVMHFDSAWSPPITIYDFLETEGWSVRAMYHEPGMGFAGRFENGMDEYYEMDWTDRDSIEELPEDILDFTNALEDLERYEEEQFEEELNELERTDWFGVATNPDKIGRYEVTTTQYEHPQYCNWDGKTWSRWEGDEVEVVKWRGLAEEYWDAAAALDKIIEDSKA